MKPRWSLPFFAVLLAFVASSLAAADSPRQRGVVVSAHGLASEAGAAILRQGGNAVDAAVATGLALAVVHPEAGNLGGGGFMLIHLAAAKRDVVIDYRETAPAAATADMYVGADGKLRRGEGSSTQGWKASGVPGTVPGFALAFARYGSGRVTWAQVCEPARRFAAEGHGVTAATVASLRASAALLGADPESKRIYLKDGAQHAVGDHWTQPELAATLQRLQENGAREFTEGETARRIAAAMAANGGLITREDLKRYQPVERIPLRGSYRGFDIVTMPPPSSGGIALLQMLQMLEHHDVRALARRDPARHVHLLAEVMKRAFRDRAEYLGDPDFVSVPIAELLLPAYTQKRVREVSWRRATPASAVQPGLGRRTTGGTGREKPETTHYAVVDGEGNAVANTYTLNGAYGSGVTVPGTGILLNNEMDDFTAQVGAPNLFGLIQGEQNAIAPGKRPLSSMTPTLVFRRGRLVLVTGSPGGPTIINTVLQVVSNVADLGMPVTAAVAAPRVHHQWLPDQLRFEPRGMAPAVQSKLKALGHALAERTSAQGEANSIGWDPRTGRWVGAPDGRNSNAAAAGE